MGGGNYYCYCTDKGADKFLLGLRETGRLASRDLTDYKFYCFQGKALYLYVSQGMANHTTAKMRFLDMDWNPAPFGRSDYVFLEEMPPKPEKFEEMQEIAERLAAGHSFLRVDLYQIDGRVYFSELTFSPCAGMMPFQPEQWDEKLGELIDLKTV